MAKNAGIADSRTQLIINGIYPCICFIAAVTGARLCDVIGRRPLLLYSIVMCSACFLIIFGTSKAATDNQANTAASYRYVHLCDQIFGRELKPL